MFRFLFDCIINNIIDHYYRYHVKIRRSPTHQILLSCTHYDAGDLLSNAFACVRQCLIRLTVRSNDDDDDDNDFLLEKNRLICEKYNRKKFSLLSNIQRKKKKDGGNTLTIKCK